MSNAKVIFLIDHAIKAEASERAGDNATMLNMLEDEIHQIHQLLEQIAMRLAVLEAREPPNPNG